MMRLTYRNGRGEACALIDGREVKGRIVDRLAQYEETGLEPEEIKEILHAEAEAALREVSE